MSALLHPFTPRHGFLLVLLAACGFGLTPLFSRLLFAEGFNPEMAMLSRFVLPAVLLVGFLPSAFRQPGRAMLAMGSGIFMGLGVIAYFQAVAVLPVALATLIYFSYPLFTALLGRLVFGLPLSRADALGCGAVLIASVLMLGAPGELSAAQSRALWLAFLAPLAFAVLILVNAQCLNTMATLPRYAAGIWGAFLVALVVNTWITPAPVGLPGSPVGWLALLGMGILASMLPQLLFTVGAPMAGPNRTALAGSAELLLGLLTGWLLLAEAVEPAQLLGGLLIGGALWLGARS